MAHIWLQWFLKDPETNSTGETGTRLALYSRDSREKQRTLQEERIKTEIWPFELNYTYKNWMVIAILIPGLFLKMSQWPWTLISRSRWVFAGVPVGSVTFKSTPSFELCGNHEDGTGRAGQPKTLQSDHADLDAESPILLSSTSSPWTTRAT